MGDVELTPTTAEERAQMADEHNQGMGCGCAWCGPGPRFPCDVARLLADLDRERERAERAEEERDLFRGRLAMADHALGQSNKLLGLQTAALKKAEKERDRERERADRLLMEKMVAQAQAAGYRRALEEAADMLSELGADEYEAHARVALEAGGTPSEDP